MNRPYLVTATVLLTGAALLFAQTGPTLSDNEKAISTQIGKLRSLPDAEWTKAVGQLARQIHELPPSSGKTLLISRFGNLVTEGDPGHETLQIVGSTIADVLRYDSPNGQLEDMLAQLVRYEHVETSLDTPAYHDALGKLENADKQRENADFTLTDLHGQSWSLKGLRGKVVLVNFWATWCPPCRKEMPDLESVYQRFQGQGLIILAVSDEDADKVKPFIAGQKYTYPIVLDPGRKVNTLFAVEGIPKSFLYNRDGKLVAEAIDRRTESQFRIMLKQAGIE
jgi:thiol-disulfide isomerase/thioredoxin